MPSVRLLSLYSSVSPEFVWWLMSSTEIERRRVTMKKGWGGGKKVDVRRINVSANFERALWVRGVRNTQTRRCRADITRMIKTKRNSRWHDVRTGNHRQDVSLFLQRFWFYCKKKKRTIWNHFVVVFPEMLHVALFFYLFLTTPLLSRLWPI